jgi:lactoylglutathione lyase
VHFGYTIAYVPDVEAAINFYENAFGLRRRFASDDWDYAELETGDTTLAFANNRMADQLGFQIRQNSADQPAAGIELAFVTDDVEAGFRKATEVGAVPVTDPHQTPWGQTVSYVRDLNGILVEICSPVSS